MARKKTSTVATTDVEIESIKGFGIDWKCRDFQFELGKTYTHDGAVVACGSGFHAVESPLDVFSYYAPGTSRYAVVKQGGAISREGRDTKIASGRITIEAELKLPDLIARAIKWITEKASPAEASHSDGDQSAASSTGDLSAASSTGYQSAASSTGYQSAASSTGDRSAASSTGDRSAASSTGYQSAASSTGDQSAASSTGSQSAASSTGDRSAASSTGYQSAASSTGYQSAAMSVGLEGRVSGAIGNALFLVYRDPDTCDILHAWAGIVGRDGIEADKWYQLDGAGKPIEVRD
jgi:hypothetical protein